MTTATFARSRIQTTRHSGRKLTASLWTAQGILAAVFLFAGVAKLVMPAEDLTANTDLSATFLRFIGAMETLGACGLVLPGLLKIRTGLTPIAACGLIVIMAGAVTVTAIEATPVDAIVPAVVGAALVFVVYGRTRIAPLRSRQPASPATRPVTALS